jgi:two-component system chemotaxis sensor kinase CheA
MDSLYGYSLEDFKEEAKDLLSRAEGIIADIRQHPGDREKINALFRVIHSLKGSAAYAGLADVNSFSHLYESFLGDLRNNRYEVSQDALNILIRSRDHLEDLIFQPEKIEMAKIDEAAGDPMQQLITLLETGKGVKTVQKEGASAPASAAKEKAKEERAPQRDLSEMDQKDVIKVTVTSTVKSIYSTLKTPSPNRHLLQKLLAKLEDSLLWAFSDGSAAAIKAVAEMKELASSNLGPGEVSKLRKAFNSMAAAIKDEISALDGLGEEKVEAKVEVKKEEEKKPSADEIRGASKDEIVRITLNRYLDALSSSLDDGSPDPVQMKRVIARLKDLNRWAFNKDKAVSASLNSMEDLLGRPYDEAVANAMKARYTTVKPAFASLLDEGQRYEMAPVEAGARHALPLQSRVSEIRIQESQKRESAQRRALPSSVSTLKIRSDDIETLIRAVSELTGVESKEIERLQAHILKLRMAPVGELFSRFRKVVRDLSGELGKGIEIEISGESVKLDKVIADRLNEPLLHMVRNAASHGLESAEDREKAGKREVGLIRLSASQEGGHVIIEVSDDGRGISLEKVRERGVEMGLIRQNEVTSEKALLDLIFSPGFSTAEEADKVSGRGVGMDVVKDVVNSLQGTVSVNTREGVGTTFRLHLPLTLAIIKAMIVEQSGYKIAIPSASIDKALTMTKEELHEGSFMDKDRLYLNLPSEGVFPMVDLSRLFGLENRTGKCCVVLVKTGTGERVALVVDSAYGRQPLMVKPLDRFAENRYFSSASFVGNELVLMLNAPSLMAA